MKVSVSLLGKFVLPSEENVPKNIGTTLTYLIGPYYAGPNLTPAPLTPAIITPIPKIQKSKKGWFSTFKRGILSTDDHNNKLSSSAKRVTDFEV